MHKTYQLVWHLFWILIGLISIGLGSYRLWGINGFILACGALIMVDEALNRLGGVYGSNTD